VTTSIIREYGARGNAVEITLFAFGWPQAQHGHNKPVYRSVCPQAPGISEALTGHRHFEQAGFIALLK
jgi:hypothetical protein